MRWLLSLQAGLIVLDQALPLNETLVWHPTTAALADDCCLGASPSRFFPVHPGELDED